MVMAGVVLVGDQKVDKPSMMVEPGQRLRLKQESASQYVSRGGDKIESAVRSLGLAAIFRDATVLDLGSSTGGFTDFALRAGARKVIAVDVGHNQLAWELRRNPAVLVFESTHVRDLRTAAANRGLVTDLDSATVVIADLSFTSLARLLPDILSAAPGAARFLLLVKPQFELDASLIPKGGVVIDPAHRKLAVELVDEGFRKNGFAPGTWVDSAVPGRTGNIEIFYYNCKTVQAEIKARAEDRQ